MSAQREWRAFQVLCWSIAALALLATGVIPAELPDLDHHHEAE